MYRFEATGHKNILANHKTTLEFIRGSALTRNGDCIIGVNADFISEKLGHFKPGEGLLISLKVNNITEQITANYNPEFSSTEEMVIRKGSFSSARTFAVNASKAAVGISRKMAEALQNPDQRIIVTICNLTSTS